MKKRITLSVLMTIAGCWLAAMAGPCVADALPARDIVCPRVTHVRIADPYAPSACSWYGGTLALKSSANLGPFSFDGSNVGIEMTCSSSSSGSFRVVLYRGNRVGDGTKIGGALFSRQGFTKATWSNVGSGNYYFAMSNAGGATVTSSDVAMYSW